jgi:hypothetical protein
MARSHATKEVKIIKELTPLFRKERFRFKHNINCYSMGEQDAVGELRKNWSANYEFVF